MANDTPKIVTSETREDIVAALKRGNCNFSTKQGAVQLIDIHAYLYDIALKNEEMSTYFPSSTRPPKITEGKDGSITAEYNVMVPLGKGEGRSADGTLSLTFKKSDTGYDKFDAELKYKDESGLHTGFLLKDQKLEDVAKSKQANLSASINPTQMQSTLVSPHRTV
jgi:hypothetical protein